MERLGLGWCLPRFAGSRAGRARSATIVTIAALCCALAPLLAGAGDFDGGLLFDGVDDVARIPESSGMLSLGSALTVEVRVVPYAFQTSGYSAFVRAGASYGLTSLGDGAWALTVSTPTTDSAISPPGDLTVGVSHHLAGTFDGTTLTIYRDGQLVATKTHDNPGPANGASELQLGVWNVSYTGVLDEVRVWSIVRSQSEIQATMDQLLTGLEPGLVGYWRLDETTGQEISDSGVNGITGYRGSTSSPDSADPRWTAILLDGFETSSTSAWSVTVP